MSTISNERLEKLRAMLVKQAISDAGLKVKGE